MSYHNAIADIAAGSLWREEELGLVSVLCAAAGYVAWRRAGGWNLPISTTPADTFRRLFRPLYDRERIRSQFTMSLANLGEFRIFWLPEQRRIMARSISCSRQFRVPEGAQLVGVYSSPCRAEDFFASLDELIVSGLQVEQQKVRVRPCTKPPRATCSCSP